MSGLFDTFNPFSGKGILDKGLDFAKESIFGGEDKEKAPAKAGAKTPETGNPLFNWLKEKMGFKKKAESIREDSEKYRSSILKEVLYSVLDRYAPRLSKLGSLAKTAGRLVGIGKGDESLAWENEFETITGLSLVIPDSMLGVLTNRFTGEGTFSAIVGYWPGMPDHFEEKIKDPNCDPDDVISILRIMHQDIVAGTATVLKVADLIPGFGKMTGMSADEIAKVFR